MSAKNYTRKELLTVGGEWVAALGFDVQDSDKPFRSSKSEADAVVYRNLKKALTSWIEGGQLAKEDDTAVYLADLPEEVQNFLIAEKIVTAEQVENDSEDNDSEDDEEEDDDEDILDASDEDEDALDEEDDEESDEDEDEEDDEEEDDLDAKLDELEDELDEEDDEEEDDDETEEEEAPAPKRGRGRPAKNAAPARATKETGLDAKTKTLKDEQRPVTVSSAPVTAANAEAAVASICKMLESGKVVVITALSIAEANAHFNATRNEDATGGVADAVLKAKRANAKSAAAPAKAATAKKETPVESGVVKRGRGRPRKNAITAPAPVEASNELSAADTRKLKAIEKKAGNEIDALLLGDMKPRSKRIAYCNAKKVKLPADMASFEACSTKQLGQMIRDHHVTRTVRVAKKELLAG